MMKTITKRIVPGRGMHYLSGMLLLILSICVPHKSFSQCIENARNNCDETTPIVIQLDDSEDFILNVFGDFYNSDPATCNASDFITQVHDVHADSLLVNANVSGPDFKYENACRYVGKVMRAELYYQDGGSLVSVCNRQVILLPKINCADTILACSHPVFESTLDESVLPIQFGCTGFDPSILNLEIINEFWNDMATMDTLFRVWEVKSNNNKGVVTCTDTIVREAIPIAEIIFPEDDTIFCNSWNGTAPTPLAAGRPYWINSNNDTLFFDVGETQHCINVSYTDEAWGQNQCEKEKYIRHWKIRIGANDIEEDTQMITVLDTAGPVGSFNFAALDSMDATIDGQIMKLPVFRISTAGQGCTSNGNLPVLHATDACMGVAKVVAEATDQDMKKHTITNGGPFQGFKEGKYLVKYTAADSCWNESEYYIWVQVEDMINPVMSLGDKYNITLTDQITWLNMEEFANHHLTDNCGIGMVVGRRVGDFANACDADDPNSIVGMYRTKYKDWLENDGWQCTDNIDLDSGWMDKIPFCCNDLGQEIMIEVMVIDGSCNVSLGMAIMVPIEKEGAIISRKLPDVTLACESWIEHYSSLIIDSAKTNNLNLDSLDKYFGTYLPQSQSNNINTPTIYVEDKECKMVDGTMVTEDKLIQTHDGLFHTACTESLTQEANLTYDEGCNTFTITRNFLINGNKIASQDIKTEIRCSFEKELFNYPAKQDTMITLANIDILKDPAYWVGNRFNLTTEGPEYKGSDCRVIAMGYVDKLLDMISSQNPNEADAVILRTWCMADWCSSDLGPDWKSSIGNNGIITWEQNIKIFVDPANPDISIEKPDPAENEEVIISPPVNKNIYEVKGRIRTEDALNVNNVTVMVKTTDHDDQMVTNESGSFEMKVNKDSRLKITPLKKGGLGNGLSTLDLILIQRHLLRKKLITSPYKLIAADANNDRKLSPADVLFLRRVILNKMDGLSDAESWKFVDANYTFINQKASYSEDYPTVLDIERLGKDIQSDFIAVKLGDVNQSANVSRSSSRSNHPGLALEIQDQELEPGDIIEVPILMSQQFNLTGIQFALKYDNNSVDVLGVKSNSLQLSDDQWTIQDGMVKVSWSDIRTPAIQLGDQMISLKLQVKRNVALKDILSFNSDVISPEIYDASDRIHTIGLSFVPQIVGSFSVQQNRPNPVKGEAVIDYELDRNAEAHLLIHDVTGKMVYRAQADGVKGYNQFRIHTSQLQPGVLYYTVTDGLHSETRKMVVIR